MLGYQPWRCMKHNLIEDVVMKPTWFLKIVWKNFIVNNLRFFNVRIIKGPKSNIFTCKLCAWVIFIILFTRFPGLDCCVITRIPSRTSHERSKVQHFHLQTVWFDISFWLFTVMIVTLTYEDIFSFVTSAYARALFF